VRSEITKYLKKVLLLVSEQLYFNDVEANEVKTTTQEEILRFLFCDKKSFDTMPKLTVSSGKSSRCMPCRSAIIITILLSFAGPTHAQGKVA
jgi:hypothetical protein